MRETTPPRRRRPSRVGKRSPEPACTPRMPPRHTSSKCAFPLCLSYSNRYQPITAGLNCRINSPERNQPRHDLHTRRIATEVDLKRLGPGLSQMRLNKDVLLPLESRHRRSLIRAYLRPTSVPRRTKADKPWQTARAISTQIGVHPHQRFEELGFSYPLHTVA